jgi:hypothetical protein
MSLATTRLRSSSANGATVSGSAAKFYLTGTSSIEAATVDGLSVTGNNTVALVRDSTIVGSGNNGLTVTSTSAPGTSTTQVTLLRSNVRQTTGFAVSAQGLSGTSAVLQVFGSDISQAGVGISAVDSNLDVRRDPTVVNGLATTIRNTGAAGVTISGQSTVQVANTAISGATVGILADNGTSSTGNANKTIQLTATNNTISSGTTGIQIVASGSTTTFNPPSKVVAYLATNRITTTTTGTTSGGITLVTQNTGTATPPLITIRGVTTQEQLGAINFNTGVVETPVDSVEYQPGLPPLPDLPPQPTPLVPVAP